MVIESNRMLGFIGALLTVIGSASAFLALARFFFPTLDITGVGTLFGVSGLVGLILFMIAMKGFAVDYKDAAIFDNALYGLLSSIAIGVVAGVLAVAVFFLNLSSVITTFTPGSVPSFTPDFLQSIMGYLVPVFLVVSVLAVVPALFNLRAFSRLAGKSGVRLFRTAGLLGLAGVAVAMIFAFIGFLLVLVASIPASAVFAISVVGAMISYVMWIVAAKAFYSIRAPKREAPPLLTPQVSAPVAGQVRYCSYCGAENMPDAVFCARCGKKL
ncbi:MAG TPA: DUF996 domain-containing protein [Acidobacteriota bacterium]|nr:DUF996 domain-containing protein [Acidobacteriota bacterium]